MSLHSLAEAYERLLPSEQALFETVLQRLLSDGFIWRGDERSAALYDFLERHLVPVSDYLAIVGWELRHYQRQKVFHLVHRDGTNRLHFTQEQTRLLLLLRLVYAQQVEQRSTDPSRLLLRHPIASTSSVFQSYIETYGIKPSKGDFHDALQRLQRLKLIRVLYNNGQQKDLSSADLELLPILEIIVPNESIAAMEERIAAYKRREVSGVNELEDIDA